MRLSFHFGGGRLSFTLEPIEERHDQLGFTTKGQRDGPAVKAETVRHLVSVGYTIDRLDRLAGPEARYVGLRAKSRICPSKSCDAKTRRSPGAHASD